MVDFKDLVVSTQLLFLVVGVSNFDLLLVFQGLFTHTEREFPTSAWSILLLYRAPEVAKLLRLYFSSIIVRICKKPLFLVQLDTRILFKQSFFTFLRLKPLQKFRLPGKFSPIAFITRFLAFFIPYFYSFLNL